MYEINRNFRNEGVSTRHNPEFTMLELYVAYADYQDLIVMVERAMQGIADVVFGKRQFEYQGRAYDLDKPFTRLTVLEAVAANTPGFDVSRARDVAYLRELCTAAGIKFKPGDGAGKLQIELFEKYAEDTFIDPTFVYAYPTEVSPLSRANDADPFLTDRFEFFVAGRELANGFSELNDAEDQAARFRAQVERKDAGDDEAMYYDADYVRALEYGMPPTAGLGVGIDRLVMFFTDAPSIRDVLLFPHMRPEHRMSPNECAHRRVRFRCRWAHGAARADRRAAGRRFPLSRRHRAPSLRHQESGNRGALFGARGRGAGQPRHQGARGRVQHGIGHRAAQLARTISRHCR